MTSRCTDASEGERETSAILRMARLESLIEEAVTWQTSAEEARGSDRLALLHTQRCDQPEFCAVHQNDQQTHKSFQVIMRDPNLFNLF